MADLPQQDARFGFAVAIDGNIAAVGAWREDVASTPDVGAVYVFVRPDFAGTFTSEKRFGNVSTSESQQCGWSVAVHATSIIYGCPGVGGEKGLAFVQRREGVNSYVTTILDPGAEIRAGDRYGTSVSLFSSSAVVGAPFNDNSGLTNNGVAFFFDLSLSPFSTYTRLTQGVFPAANNDQFGASVAVNDLDTVFVGAPNFNSGRGTVFMFKVPGGTQNNEGFTHTSFEGVGTQFGSSIAVSERVADGSQTLVISAPGDDNERGADAGAAFVYTRRGDSGTWNFQQKLTAGDGRAGDFFGANAVAIEGNTIVVGAYGNGEPLTTNTDDNRGAVYVFMRNDPGWTQQAKISPNNFQGGEPDAAFGISVGVSGNTLIAGARAASAGSTERAGAAFNYFLDCVAPASITISAGAAGTASPVSIPRNRPLDLVSQVTYAGLTTVNWQWRKNGANIPGKHNFDYRVPNVCPADAGTYDVVGSTACSSMISNAITVNVTPRITGHPVSSTVCESGVATLGLLKVLRTPSGETTYRIRKDGVNQTPPISIPNGTGEFSTNVTVTSAAASGHAGNYDMVVSDSCGTEVSNPGTLTVLPNSIGASGQNFTASGGTGAVAVTACTAGGQWSAQSNDSWITVSSPTGYVTGDGNVIYSVAANSGPQRTGTLSVAGKTFTVMQAGEGPAANTFQFSQSGYTVGEGAQSAAVTVTRTGDLSAPASVEYATTDGTASDRGDYNTTIGRLRFAADEASKVFAVLVNDDAYAESPESLSLTLSNPAGGFALGSPATATLTITDNDAATSPNNPLDTTGFHVRQHYVDFLNRTPDIAGFNFWTGGIDSCGADPGCREVKRIDTSAAFFLSIEFQETGFLVHRLYRAAFNRLARYREFIRDSQEMGRGVVVNAPGWEAQLEANKVAFVSEFAARQEFQALYSGMSNAQYVDALNANAGGSLSQAERDALVVGLDAGAESRPTALRKVAEDADLRARETSPAFVLMQYFGYLRRSPDDPPDADLSGYNFWLGKLNSFAGDYRRAEMVKAFITSIEYRKRFGQ